MPAPHARTWLDVLLLSRDVGDFVLCVRLAVVAVDTGMVLAMLAVLVPHLCRTRAYAVRE